MIVHPYDDYRVLAGQASIACEMHEQVREQDQVQLDAILVTCSGGGLASGTALVSRKYW